MGSWRSKLISSLVSKKRNFKIFATESLITNTGTDILISVWLASNRIGCFKVAWRSVRYQHSALNSALNTTKHIDPWSEFHQGCQMSGSPVCRSRALSWALKNAQRNGADGHERPWWLFPPPEWDTYNTIVPITFALTCLAWVYSVNDLALKGAVSSDVIRL